MESIGARIQRALPLIVWLQRKMHVLLLAQKPGHSRFDLLSNGTREDFFHWLGALTRIGRSRRRRAAEPQKRSFI